MRTLHRSPEPQVLADNKVSWLAEFLADPNSNYRKTKYRHPNVKSQLMDDSGHKCAYCESKIGHNTPGDVEHLVPTSANNNLHFEWTNMGVACTECNRRKNDYNDLTNPFLNPYSENVEEQVEHHGPLVLWKTGNVRAEISIKKLQLNGSERIDLIKDKIQKLKEIDEAVQRYSETANPALKAIMGSELLKLTEANSEYSGMILSFLTTRLPELFANGNNAA